MTQRTVRFLLNGGLVAGSLVLLADTLRFVAQWRMDAMDGIFLMHASVLATIIFAYLAKDACYTWPTSILKTENEQ